MIPEHDHILDEYLVLQAQGGDMKAYSILIKRWHPRMINHAYRMTQDPEVAKDITQEAWKAITTRLRSLKSPEAFKVWVYRIISNKAADWIKRRQQERNLVRENEGLEVAGEAETNIDSVRAALNELPEESKLMLTMFYLDGHSVKAIGEILNISEGTVKSRLFYSRKKLKERFTHVNSEK